MVPCPLVSVPGGRMSLPTAPLPGCAFLRYAEHTHPPSPGSQTPGTIRPHILLRPHRGRIHPSHKPICAHLRFSVLLCSCPSISKPICLRARRAHASERRMCITVGAAPAGRRTYGSKPPQCSRLKGGTSQLSTPILLFCANLRNLRL